MQVSTRQRLAISVRATHGYPGFLAAERIAAIIFATSVIAGPAQAQMALSPGAMVGFAGVSAAHYDNQRRSATRRASAPVSNGWAAALASGPVARGAAVDTDLRFVSTEQSRRQAEREYLARLRKQDAAAAAALGEQLQRNNFSRVYSGIVRPFGLSSDDAADALTGYTVLGWLIATGAPDPSPSAVSAARNQIAARLGQTPNFRSAASRQALGEELKISFVTLHAGWQAARREGNLRQYGDGVAALFNRNGIDLRALRLTRDGFTAR